MLRSLLLFSSLILISVSVTGSQGASRTLVKTAIIYNLEDYIYWPKSITNNNHSIGILGEPDIYNLLSRYQEIGADDSHPVQVLHFPDFNSYQPVHILYISNKFISGVMEKLKDKPVMLIGEGFDCWKDNLHICMVKEGNKYRLKIDPISFETSGLDLNPELIDLIKSSPE